MLRAYLQMPCVIYYTVINKHVHFKYAHTKFSELVYFWEEMQTPFVCVWLRAVFF